MVVQYLQKFREAKRDDVDKLLRDKLSDALSEEQKTHFIKNLIQEMRATGTIVNRGSKAGPGALWVLAKAVAKPPS